MKYVTISLDGEIKYRGRVGAKFVITDEDVDIEFTSDSFREYVEKNDLIEDLKDEIFELEYEEWKKNVVKKITKMAV